MLLLRLSIAPLRGACKGSRFNRVLAPTLSYSFGCRYSLTQAVYAHSRISSSHGISITSSSRESPTLYQPLASTVKEVRLLELHPGNQDQDIRCSLHHHRLDASTSYEALSYVWGSQRDKEPISIGTNRFEVTVDLAAALRRLSARQTSRLLWIDQICINQNDLAERAAQVNLMQNIYEAATRVIVWLGEEDETSNKAMSFIHKYEHIVQVSQADNRSDVLHHIFSEPSNKAEIEAIVQAIMINPYFERHWIIQEIVLARDSVVYCGSRSASWRTVIQFMMGVVQYNPSLVDTARKQRNDSSPIGYLWGRLNGLQEQRRQGQTLLFEPWWLVLWFRYCKATVPSDRIYSWLSLCEQWRQTEFKIDYKMHHHDVFKHFAQVMIEHDRNLSWLSHAGSPRTFATLPSWVPDLELPIGMRPDPLVLMKGLYSADRGSEFGARFSMDSSSFFCTGVSIDRISYVTSTAEECLGVCLDGSLDSSATPPKLLHAVTSRYGDALEFELEDLYTAGRRCSKDGSGPARNLSGITFVKILRKMSKAGGVGPEYASWLNAMYLLGESTLGIRTVFVSEMGYVGLVPEYARIGDVVCVLFGSEVPVVLRKEGDYYRFIGDCYAAGLMDGEYADLVERGKTKVEIFELR